MIDFISGIMTVYIIKKKQDGKFIALEQFPRRAEEWLDGDFDVEEFCFDIRADDYCDDTEEVDLDEEDS